MILPFTSQRSRAGHFASGLSKLPVVSRRTMRIEPLEDRRLLAIDALFSDNLLTLSSDADDQFVVSEMDGAVLVNGQLPGGEKIAARKISQIQIHPGPETAAIDVSAISRQVFTAIDQISLEGGPWVDPALTQQIIGVVLGPGWSEKLGIADVGQYLASGAWKTPLGDGSLAAQMTDAGWGNAQGLLDQILSEAGSRAVVRLFSFGASDDTPPFGSLFNGHYDHLLAAEISPTAAAAVLSEEPRSADLNGDGTVDAADYTVWANTAGQAGDDLAADLNGDRLVDVADYDLLVAEWDTTEELSHEFQEFRGAGEEGDPPPAPGPWPTISISGDTQVEGTTLSFSVSLSEASDDTVTVEYSTVPNTAVTPEDYTFTEGMITFAPGQVLQTVSVVTIDDAITEPDQNFLLNLFNNVNAFVEGDGTAVGVITDNDALEAVVVWVNFGGTDKVTIIQDPQPDNPNPDPLDPADWTVLPGIVYSVSHYQDVNHNGAQDAPDDHQYPVAYVRDAIPTLGVLIWISKNQFVGAFSIKGTGDWSINLPETLGVAIDSGEGDGSKIVSASITSTNRVPDEVDYKDVLTVNWEIKVDDDDAWVDAGASQQDDAYLTYATKATPTVFHTVIHLGSKGADGATTEQATVDDAWSEFADNSVATVEGDTLTYYNGYQPWCSTTAVLLAYHDGRCGAWARLFQDVLAVQGIGSELVTARPTTASGFTGFFVNDWSPTVAGNMGPYTMLMRKHPSGSWNPLKDDYSNGYQFPYAQLDDDDGAAGQSESNPASIFGFHIIVKHLGVYYDPSYGTTRANEQALDNAMFGFFVQKEGTFDETVHGDLNGDGVIEAAVTAKYLEVTKNPAGNQIFW